jgi:hypothetical protein
MTGDSKTYSDLPGSRDIGTWSALKGKPSVTVSPLGIANGVGLNGGADFGPDTPNTVTSGIQEALLAGPVSLRPGSYYLSAPIVLPVFAWLEGRASSRGIGWQLSTAQTYEGSVLVPAAGQDCFQIANQGTVPYLHNVTVRWASDEATGWGINTTATTDHMVNNCDLDGLHFINCENGINAINWMYGHWGKVYVSGTNGALINLEEEDANNNYGNLTIDFISANQLSINGSTHLPGQNLININHLELFPKTGFSGTVLSLNNAAIVNFGTVTMGSLGSGSPTAIGVATCNDVVFQQTFIPNSSPVSVTGSNRVTFDEGGYAWVPTVDSSSLPTTICRRIGGVNFQGFGYASPNLPGATGATHKVTNSNPFPVVVYIAMTSFDAYGVRIVDLNNTTVGPPADPMMFTLNPGESVWFATSVPSAWRWYGL